MLYLYLKKLLLINLQKKIIFKKFMGLIDILLKDKISVKEETQNTMSLQEAKAKVTKIIDHKIHIVSVFKQKNIN